MVGADPQVQSQPVATAQTAARSDSLKRCNNSATTPMHCKRKKEEGKIVTVHREATADYLLDNTIYALTFRTPRKASFSAFVCQGLWPNLDEVSMNLRLSEAFSRSRRLVATFMDFRRVRGRLTVPTHDPLMRRKSLLTTPYRTKPPRGVIFLCEMSNSVAPLASSSPFPTR